MEDQYTLQNESANSENCVYYGVYIPADYVQPFLDGESNPNVFEDKNSVLQLLKQHKRARFKAFNLIHEAADFALNGSEHPNNSVTIESSKLKSTADASQLLGEKPSPFKGPKPQDLIILRKAIEKGDYECVDTIIWTNPRYLISNGDTPSILQEGSRYNALHIAAKSKNSKIAELILNTVSNVEFVKLLYGDDNIDNGKERANVFTDLYLNTPDKGLNETPLHFAVKFGAVEVVEVLVSYPQCDKTVKNKYGQTSSMMICDRLEKPDKTIQRKIQQLLEETYYVPVLRAEDNSVPPKIGEPFSPVNPPVYSNHPSSPRLEIQAYAGPMNKEGAEHFRKVWKTPPRSLKFNTTNKKLDDSTDSIASLKYKDPLKGLELVGKTLATQYDITWREYWPFLDSFVDITSEEGLNMLESYLKSRVLEISRSIGCASLESSVCEKTDMNLSSISELCRAFQAFHLISFENDFQNELDSKLSSNFSSFLCLERACQVFAHRLANGILNAINGNLINILDTEIKQLELVILSYMDDTRFSNINFSCVHYRLCVLVAQQIYFKYDSDRERESIYRRVESLIEICSKSFDCFSSDDEGVNTKDVLAIRKGTSIRKQLLCLAHSILSLFSQDLNPHYDIVTEQDCLKVWEDLTPCGCILYTRKTRKTSSLQRNNSKRRNSDPVRKLFKEEKEDTGCSQEDCDSNNFFSTPISSPEISDDDEDDEFDDAETLDLYDVYLEGKFPSKTDGAVFNALKYSRCDIDSELYPNIYLWRHNVAQFQDEERSSWRHQKNFECSFISPTSSSATPQRAPPTHTSTPTKSWLRITGVHSPKNSKQRSFVSGI